CNPLRDLSLQLSYGHLHSPEGLEPLANQHRLTASATYHHNFGPLAWQTTFAWGRNIVDSPTGPDLHPGRVLDGFLLESAFLAPPHSLAMRAERVTKDELFRE